MPDLGTEHRATVPVAHYGPQVARAISARIGKRLVLHGSSSVPDTAIGTLALDGIIKVNLWTTFERVGGQAVARFILRQMGNILPEEELAALRAEGWLGERYGSEAYRAEVCGGSLGPKLSGLREEHRRDVWQEAVVARMKFYLDAFHYANFKLLASKSAKKVRVISSLCLPLSGISGSAFFAIRWCDRRRTSMKRSMINTIMREADDFMRKHGFYLPPFAYWTAADWAMKGEEVREIVDRELGWDITDFGQGDYYQIGLFVFTIRNGTLEALRSGKGKTYAEKVLVSDVGQVTPMHFHWTKTEDIINRGGGKLAIQLYNSTEDNRLADTDVTVSIDGVRCVVKAGDTVTLSPGESITLTSGLYHKFWGAESRVLIGEVSLVNDDNTDNRFCEPVGRFPEIEEDEPPLYLLVKDYARYYRPLQTR